MDYILYILIFYIGAIFGSFITLAIDRIPLKQDITHKHSYCPHCKHKLSFLDVIPIFSYLVLGGRCRYCKKKIGPRYILLEILTGVTFVLFAASIKLSIVFIDIQNIIYFIVGIIYLTILFIIAGIDRKKKCIEKSILMIGYIIVTIYMIYLYVVENMIDANIYRYVIYLLLACILIFLSIIHLKKKGKDSYTIDVLLLSLFMVLYTYETIYIFTVIITLIAIVIQLLLHKLVQRKNKYVRKVKKENSKIPIGFYMCTANIVILIILNFTLLYV